MSDVKAHYDAVAAEYSRQYQPDQLLTLKEYPANYFRLQLLKKAFVSKGIRRVLEVGVGEGTPLLTLAQEGMDVWGFDISDRMVERAKATFAGNGLDANRICCGDVRDPATYAPVADAGPFDGVIVMGVMPHVEDDASVIKNIHACVRQGGTVFIEFRNKLFSLFTFNRYSYEFMLDDLLAGVDPEFKQSVAEEIKPRLRMDLPPVRDRLEDGSPGYDAIPSRFHNPLEVPELFRRHGFGDIELLWYHYHPAPPMLESKLGPAFRTQAFKLEGEGSGWRGLFLCSAFVVQATRLT